MEKLAKVGKISKSMEMFEDKRYDKVGHSIKRKNI